MHPDRWAQVERLFQEVTELPQEQRSDFLERECRNDAQLKSEVESLLQSLNESDPFLEGPALGESFSVDAEEILDDAFIDPVVGTEIGQYKIVERLAAGGMGAVYRAARADDMFDQVVAIKIVKRGMDSEQILQRFRAERRTLANLSHPNIARLFDGGITDDGRPYLVMEYIEGQPIDEYCDTRRIGIEGRLQLMQSVCGAVHYAHQNLVVHRDLKPSNILVTPDGEPKLLDFGISKVIDPESDDGTVDRTLTSMRMMTPDYASPEQIRGESVTTASDIYSLGVILYGLLSGRSPYRVTSRRFDDIERVVCDQHPRKPSTALLNRESHTPDHNNGTAELSPEEVSARRNASLDRLHKHLAGDLDNIVMMALRKEPERRYSSAQHLSQDVQHFLDGLPVSARRDTVTYRIAKFVKRNRALVAAASLALLIDAGLIVGLIQRNAVAHDNEQRATLEADNAAHEAEHARIEAASARETSEFLTNVFLTSTPQLAQHGQDNAQILLDLEVERVRRQYGHQRHLQANLLDAIGRVYTNLGETTKGVELIDEALTIRRDEFGDESLEVALSLNSLGEVAIEIGDPEAARAHFDKALRLHRQLPRGVHTDIALAANNLGVALRQLGELDEASRLFSESLSLRRKRQQKHDPLVAESLNNMSGVQIDLGKYAEAVTSLEEVLDIRSTIFGDSHPLTAQALNNLAIAYEGQGETQRAIDTLNEAITRTRGLPGVDDAGLAKSLSSLARMYVRSDRPEKAQPLLVESLNMLTSMYGPDHPSIATARANVARVHEKLGDIQEAEKCWDEALRIRTGVYGDEHAIVASTRTSYGSFLQNIGKPARAEKQYRTALSVYEDTLPEDHWFIGIAKVSLGMSLMSLDQLDEAQHYLESGHAILMQTRGEDSREARHAANQLKRLETRRAESAG